MSSTPTASVIIVSRDRPELLKRAIESVFEQDHRPIELILVDNQSTPPIEAPAAPDGVTVQVFRTPFFMNASQSRNYGIDRVTGDFISFLDDDDYYLQGKLSKQVKAMQDNPDADFSIMDYVSHDADGTERNCGLHDINDYVALMRWVPVHTNSLFIRTDVARAVKFNETLDKFTDLYVTFNLFEHYTPVKAEGAGSVFHRTNRPDQITNTKLLKKITGAGRNYRNWKKICDLFAHRIDPSPILRKEYYGRQMLYSAATLNLHHALHYGLASIGWRDNAKAEKQSAS